MLKHFFYTLACFLYRDSTVLQIYIYIHILERFSYLSHTKCHCFSFFDCASEVFRLPNPFANALCCMAVCALRWAEGERENKFSSRTPACNWLSEFAFLTIYVCIVRGMRGWCSFHGDHRDLFGTQAAPSKKMVFLSWRSTPTLEYTQFTHCAVRARSCFFTHNSVRKIFFFDLGIPRISFVTVPPTTFSSIC